MDGLTYLPCVNCYFYCRFAKRARRPWKLIRSLYHTYHAVVGFLDVSREGSSEVLG